MPPVGRELYAIAQFFMAKQRLRPYLGSVKSGRNHIMNVRR
jgi:hypothetical protein